MAGSQIHRHRIPINCEKSHTVSPLAHFMQSPSSRAYILYHLKIDIQTLGFICRFTFRIARPVTTHHPSHATSYLCYCWLRHALAHPSTYGALLKKANLIIIRKFFFHLFFLFFFFLVSVFCFLFIGFAIWASFVFLLSSLSRAN